jgi:hypothetical protein
VSSARHEAAQASGTHGRGNPLAGRERDEVTLRAYGSGSGGWRPRPSSAGRGWGPAHDCVRARPLVARQHDATSPYVLLLRVSMGRLLHQFFRVWTRSAPEGDDGNECDGRDVVSGQLVVAGGDATEVLEAIEGRFNPPAFAVAAFVVADLPLAAALAGDDRRDAFFP